MEFENRSARIDRIDTGNLTFQISSNPDLDSLITSMDRIGLIQPPVLIAKDTQYQIICGFRRVMAADALGWSQLPVRVVPNDSAPERLAALAVADNISQRPLNRLETARSLFLLSRSIPDPDAFRKTAKVLGLPASAKDIDKFLRVFHLPESVQKGLGQGAVSLAAALQFEEFSKSEADRIMQWMDSYRFSVNRQRDILLFLKEISKRDRITVMEILCRDDLQEIIESFESDGNRIAGGIHAFLKKMRFPALSAVEKEFHQRVAELNLPKNIRLDPPPHFEGNLYQLTIRFQDPNQLRAARTTLQDLHKDEKFSKLFRRFSNSPRE